MVLHLLVKSKTNEKNTLKPVEVTCISSNGVWIIVNEIEYYLTYSDFKWFKEAKVQEVLNVKLLGEKHLYWPDLDIDLDIDSFKNIEKYPLVYNES